MIVSNILIGYAIGYCIFVLLAIHSVHDMVVEDLVKEERVKPRVASLSVLLSIVLLGFFYPILFIVGLFKFFFRR